MGDVTTSVKQTRQALLASFCATRTFQVAVIPAPWLFRLPLVIPAQAGIHPRSRAWEAITRRSHYGMYITVSYKSFHPGFVDSINWIFQARSRFLRCFSR